VQRHRVAGHRISAGWAFRIAVAGVTRIECQQHVETRRPSSRLGGPHAGRADTRRGRRARWRCESTAAIGARGTKSWAVYALLGGGDGSSPGWCCLVTRKHLLVIAITQI
jgi:hypothetical protein